MYRFDLELILVSDDDELADQCFLRCN